MRYIISIHDWASLDELTSYTSTYVPNVGEIVDVSRGSVSVVGKVIQKKVKERPGREPAFYLYLNLDDNSP